MQLHLFFLLIQAIVPLIWMVSKAPHHLPAATLAPNTYSPNSSHHDSFKKSDQILSLLCSESFNASHPNAFRLGKKKSLYSGLYCLTHLDPILLLTNFPPTHCSSAALDDYSSNMLVCFSAQGPGLLFLLLGHFYMGLI